ncbi:PP2C family protein-serine/threonine phosphatase [Actinacidiphila yeochonensis]|uniref:PP2C family protein-serine/threonine phosphatase n=1 Tax=Actinacidiphila yeochonensis TaxID=89050 RepID=UPI00055AD50A
MSPSPAAAVVRIPPLPRSAAVPAQGAPGTAPAAVQRRLASWVCDLALLHELGERLARTSDLSDALHEVLRAGADLLGARRGLLILEPADGLGPHTSVGLGLGRSDLGALETVPRMGAETPGHRDLLHEPGLAPRHREVALQLGLAASFCAPLVPDTRAALGAAVWFYDEPAVPSEQRFHLVDRYLRLAVEHVARCLELDRTRRAAATLAAELLPPRLPRVPGVRTAVRHTAGPRGGGDWYDVLPLPEGAFGLAVGGVTGAGPGAVAAMGRLRASLRAYAVMEGEDPVAVLSDLELLLRTAEPARSATALFVHADALPGGGCRLALAGAGHCPPLLVGERHCEFVETSLSAPLNMLSCWEAPGVELRVQPGESLLLFTDGLLHRTGDPADQAFARLREAAADAPAAVRGDPELLADHVTRTLLPDGRDQADDPEDLVLLAACFD